jgi:hypothetical protein
MPSNRFEVDKYFQISFGVSLLGSKENSGKVFHRKCHQEA